MTIIPVLLDARPPYLAAGGDDASLLLLPTGAGTVLAEIVERAAAVTSRPPLVLPRFDAGPGYADALRRAEPDVAGVVGTEIFRDPLARFDPSDVLLLVSPECYPMDGVDLRPLVGERVRDARMLRHLLAFDTSPLGAKEFVQSGADGRLRRVQRYFEPVTWTFPAGIVASLVPVACVLMAGDTLPTSLPALRAALSAQGVPSRDVTHQGRLVDLGDEPGALALAEHRLLRLVAEVRGGSGAPVHAPLVLGHDARIDPTARFVGPVVVGGGACVEAGALVVGPTLVGRGAHVGRAAAVAQCLLVDGARVAAEASVRHRVLADASAAGGAGGAGAAAAVPQRRQAFGGTPAPSPPLRRGGYHTAKAVVEPVVAALLLLLLSPILVTCAALVVLDSGLPVFYGDRREGRAGRPFRCWKFRSMRANAAALQRELAGAQQLDGPQFKMERDPRVTRVGRWLRRLNVDELPQLWNVVRGQMSFIGPRPSPFRENQICIPWRHGRLSVRPGITGLWQVCRHDRASGDFHQWIHYDLLYVRHASLRVDARIFAATLLTLGGKRPTPLERILPDARGHTPLGHVPGASGAPRPTPAASAAAVAPAAAAAHTPHAPQRATRLRAAWPRRPRNPRRG